MKKSFVKLRDCPAGIDIDIAIVEDVASFRAYVYGGPPLGEFTSKVVAEETCFAFQKGRQPFTRILRPDGLTDSRRTKNQKAR